MTDSQQHHENAPDTGADPATAAPAQDDAAQKIATLEAALTEANDKMLRALADAENTRRRGERERQDTAKFAVAGFARALLSVSDNLRRALNAIAPEQRAAHEALQNIYEGVEATERELLRVFEANGIRKLDPMGEKFDPNLHEVMFEVPAAGVPAGTVMQVIDVGYMIHERLLRPARVGVAKGDETGETAHVDRQV